MDAYYAGCTRVSRWKSVSGLHDGAKISGPDEQVFFERDRVRWTLTHAYYANMGGFILKVDSSALVHTNQDPSQDVSCQPHTLPVSKLDEDQVNAGPKNNAARKGQECQLSTQSSVAIDVEKAQQKPTMECQELAHPIAASSSNTKPNVKQPSGPSSSDKKLENIEYAYLNADQLYALRDTMVITRLPEVSVKEIEEQRRCIYQRDNCTPSSLAHSSGHRTRGKTNASLATRDKRHRIHGLRTPHIRFLMVQTTECHHRKPRQRRCNPSGEDQSTRR